jgi:acyl-CoA reductase-like NAD-dependent aldehyde dehydrogenase
MEGLNAYGIWDFSDWSSLAQQIRKAFEYGKQRCTAYPRFVVKRDHFARFLETYLPVIESVRFGHPLLVADPLDAVPPLDFGPLINSNKVEELTVRLSEAKGKGAVPLFEGKFREELFLPGQDISSYFPPCALMNIPRNCSLYHREPFGPIDSLVVVDTLEEMVNEMNVSGGSLVASIATDDPKVALRIRREVRAFKVGVNVLRSRGDRDELFGGVGQSWKGCFVGGIHLVRAITYGPADDKLYGNFPEHVLMPETN